jgi:hypothetical protein
MTAVTRRGCRRGKHSEGWSVARKARRWAICPRPRPTATRNQAAGTAATPPDSSGWSSLTDRPTGGFVSRRWLGGRKGGDPSFVEASGRDGGDTATTGTEASRRAAQAPWRGCGRGDEGGGESIAEPETWRTPWSAAGRNRPARPCAEQAVEAGRNGRDGTSPGAGSPGPKATPPARGWKRREWTRKADVDGGAIFGQPQERSPYGHDTGVWPTARWCRAGRSRSDGRLGLVVSEGEDKARGSCRRT